MPTFVHGKGTAVYVDGYDLSAYFNSTDLSHTIDTAETTAFGDTAKAYIQGTSDGTLSLSGMFDGAAGASDAVLESILTAATEPVVSVHMSGPAVGDSAVIAKAHETNYAVSNPIADVVSITADFNATADNDTNAIVPVVRAVQLTASAAVNVSAMPVNSASVDNTASTTGGGMAAFHITQNSGNGTDYTVKVQHSTDDAAWADLITFTAVAAGAIGSGFATVTGTVNRYVRAQIITTGGTTGTVTHTVNFARFGRV